MWLRGEDSINSSSKRLLEEMCFKIFQKPRQTLKMTAMGLSLTIDVVGNGSTQEELLDFYITTETEEWDKKWSLWLNACHLFSLDFKDPFTVQPPCENILSSFIYLKGCCFLYIYIYILVLNKNINLDMAFNVVSLFLFWKQILAFISKLSG